MSPRGGFRKGAGRRRTEDPKAKRVWPRLSEAEYATIAAAAALDNQTPSEWVRAVALAAAERRIGR